jgi:hypothetical protein
MHREDCGFYGGLIESAEREEAAIYASPAFQASLQARGLAPK